MRRYKVFHRSVRTIVQQTNVVNTKELLKDIANGRPINVNPGHDAGSFDLEGQDQATADVMSSDRFGADNPMFVGFDNLMSQHIGRSKIFEHLHPTKPAPAPAPVPEPSPSPTPEPSPAE